VVVPQFMLPRLLSFLIMGNALYDASADVARLGTNPDSLFNLAFGVSQFLVGQSMKRTSRTK
jgi:hypothetical protein